MAIPAPTVSNFEELVRLKLQDDGEAQQPNLNDSNFEEDGKPKR
jgi:hypothetical protein